MKDFQRYFRLRNALIGVKFIFKSTDEKEISKENSEEFNQNNNQNHNKLRFCKIVRLASSGRRFLVSSENLDCFGAEMSLGFIKPLNDKTTQEIIVEELQENEEYDVVIAIANPEEVMRISTLYHQIKNKRIRAEFKGDKAVCGEATAEVFKTGKPNISFLCHGAREYSEYLPEDVVIGFPFETFKEIVDAIIKKRIKAMCGCSMDDIPTHVIEKMEALGFNKTTDHFIGIFNGKIVKAYIFRDMTAISLFTSIKLRDEVIERDYECYVNTIDKTIYLTRRGKWLDISTIVEFDNITRDVLSKSFDENLLERMDKLIKITENFKKELKT